MKLENTGNEKLYFGVKTILENAREKAYTAINFAMVEAYWNVGKMIVEAQGQGDRAEYRDYLIKCLSEKLTSEFGKGFTTTNLKYMRQFYLAFPIGHTLCDQLSWSHYRLLSKIQKEPMRKFYVGESVKCNWSVRQLERQINIRI